MPKVGNFLLVALITTLGLSACGDSRSYPPPSPTPTRIPDPTPTPAINLACGDDLKGLQLAVAGETFLASFNREFGESQLSQLRVEALSLIHI